MNKGLLIGIGATAAATTGVAYYVSPTSPEVPATIPPILLAGSPEDVLEKVRRTRLERYFQHAGLRSDEQSVITLKTSQSAPEEAVGTLSIFRDRVLLIRVRARAAGSGRTALDIEPELIESKFSTQPALHPHDRKLLVIFADLIVTDYLSSVLKGERMASWHELEKALTTYTGLDDDAIDALKRRFDDAMAAAYSEDAKALVTQAEIDGDPSEGWGGGKGSRDWGDGKMAYDAVQDPLEAAEDRRVAAELRREAREAQKAAREAQKAAWEARRAARY